MEVFFHTHNQFLFIHSTFSNPQGSWQNPFHPHLTHVARFMAGGKHPVPVVTMTTKASFPRSYYPDLQMTLLELPYGHSGRYGLFVLLPDRQDGLPMLEKRLRHFSLESMLSESHWVRTAKVGGDCGTRREIVVWGDSDVDG